MSAASVSPHGFVAVRGRGYPVEKVDAYVTSLSRDRDDAWERAARLTVLAKEMEAEAARLREVLAALGPQTYESLGRRAQYLWALTEEEAEAVRTGVREEAQAIHDGAQAAARQAQDGARAHADELRATAEAYAQQILLGAQSTADEMRIEARLEVKEQRTKTLTDLRDARSRAEGTLTDLGNDQAEQWEALGREVAAREGAVDARNAELSAVAEAGLADAERAFAESEEHARHSQEDAEARAAQLIAEARLHEDRTQRETDRVLREHEGARDEMEAHMAHIRNSLATLTGRAAAEG
ncbi:cellulose-binding protein [Streptomyces sp. NPDC051907]|uniref:cellulose-binding protein n=1 Tax=Streptomyces sp. NPDC051907 TaxID=3155284 RepID=UPI003445C078